MRFYARRQPSVLGGNSADLGGYRLVKSLGKAYIIRGILTQTFALSLLSRVTGFPIKLWLVFAVNTRAQEGRRDREQLSMAVKEENKVAFFNEPIR